eukprot:1256554-Alexandrium_andersonii.AAC.1
MSAPSLVRIARAWSQQPMSKAERACSQEGQLLSHRFRCSRHSWLFHFLLFVCGFLSGRWFLILDPRSRFWSPVSPPSCEHACSLLVIDAWLRVLASLFLVMNDWLLAPDSGSPVDCS